MDLQRSALLTDLYQLTMLQAYLERGMEEPAVFEFFVRRLPPTRGFLMAAGLEQALDYLTALRFTEQDLTWLLESGRFSRSFIDYLERFRFHGDVLAIAEGTVCFPDEPILQVIAPLPHAQLVETRLMNLLHFQTMIASKAARLVLLVRGTPLVDFGLRRAHGAEAGLYAARASYLAGFSGTATVLAAALFEIPLYGTMAHSFIQAHKDELEAFEQFAASQPANVILLIDTYDTEAAAAKVVALAPRLRQRGIAIKGVRLDSGDLVDHARRVRRILDEGGMNEVQIVVSGNLHERTIKELIAAGAPVDSFAVGTDVTTSADVPYLDSAYKLQEYAGRPRRKRSEGKATWPGRKQVYRYYRADGTLDYDIVTLASDHRDDEALLQPVMQDGRRLFPPRPLGELREHAAHQLNRLPDDLRSLRESPIVPVQISSALRDLAASLDHQS